MIATVKNQGHPKKVGVYAVETRLKLAGIVVIPSILHHVEAFPYHTEKEIQKLESVQLQMLTGILELPSSTSYCALLLETGWWRMRARIHYKKLMLFHNIVHSDGKRVVKRLLNEQEKENRETTWFGSIQKIKNRYGIELDEKDTIKSAWKKYVKTKITEVEEQEIRKQCREKTKARTVKEDEYECKSYLRSVTLKEVKKIARYRLHMCKLPSNYRQKGVSMCPLCEEEEGRTEHYFKCEYTRRLSNIYGVTEADLGSQDIRTMKNVANFYEKVEQMLQPILDPM